MLSKLSSLNAEVCLKKKNQPEHKYPFFLSRKSEQKHTMKNTFYLKNQLEF